MLKKLFCFFIGLLFLTILAFSQDVKVCEFAGSWYPGDKDTLSKNIDNYLRQADLPKMEGQVLGVIAPHAGYQFSAPVAAYSYKLLTGRKYDAVILFGSTHKYYFSGAQVYPEGEFKTPLGDLRVDADIAKELCAIEEIKPGTEYFSGEHSLEMQMPFVYKTLPGTPIVPVIIGDVNFENIEHIAQRLFEVSKKKDILVIVSSDMSHYHPYDDAKEIDAGTIELIRAQRGAKLWMTRGYSEGRACGIAGIAILLEYLDMRHGHMEILNACSSGDTSGDKSKVVGYLSAAAMFIPGQDGQKKEKVMEEFTLDADDKKRLLSIARETLELYVRDGKIPKFKAQGVNINSQRGAFVTLTKYGQLRGCIGNMVSDQPLYRLISEMAIQACAHDPRFSPVRENELKDIDIEISVLTPMKPVKSLDDIVVGRDGLLLRKGFNQGVFLPQVPAEQGWDKTAYLENLCYKAGLSDKNAYMDSDAKLMSFEAIVFGEKE